MEALPTNLKWYNHSLEYIGDCMIEGKLRAEKILNNIEHLTPELQLQQFLIQLSAIQDEAKLSKADWSKIITKLKRSLEAKGRTLESLLKNPNPDSTQTKSNALWGDMPSLSIQPEAIQLLWEELELHYTEHSTLASMLERANRE
jgi:hypothetical protein